MPCMTVESNTYAAWMTVVCRLSGRCCAAAYTAECKNGAMCGKKGARRRYRRALRGGWGECEGAARRQCAGEAVKTGHDARRRGRIAPDRQQGVDGPNTDFEKKFF